MDGDPPVSYCSRGIASGFRRRSIGQSPMSNDKLRRRIATAAARLISTRQESSIPRARMRVARQLINGYVKPDQFPSDAEIRDELERQSYVAEGDARFDNLKPLRFLAHDLMSRWESYQPRIHGTLVSGTMRRTGLIEIQMPLGSLREFAREECLAEEGDAPENLEQLAEDGILTFEVSEGIEVRLEEFHETALSGLDLEEYREFLRHEYPDDNAPDQLDRFQVYRMLLQPLSKVQQHRSSHPEGDALYHSLQVYNHAVEELPYDEEFQLAALLHDVGKAIDPLEHVRASTDALAPYVTERTLWFVEHHQEAHKLLQGTLGARARRRLVSHPDYEELLILARLDRKGRVCGASVPTLDEALGQIRELARMCSG